MKLQTYRANPFCAGAPTNAANARCIDEFIAAAGRNATSRFNRMLSP